MTAVRPFDGARRVAVWFAFLLSAWLIAVSATAQGRPDFPPLTGRVVDSANLLSPQVEAEITRKLEALQAESSDQLVVATVPDLQGLEIEEYGYQLGRAWGVGQSETDNGVLLLVAPNERKVRIEVGYGLEPILTDALSGLIIRNDILPAFRDGDYERGVVAGVDAIDEQLRLDPAEAQARAAAAATEHRSKSGPTVGMVTVFVIILLYLALLAMGSSGRRGRRRNNAWLWAAGSAIGSSGSRSSWGGGGGGGGGFSGGGGSFGGGGASGGW